jgi:UDP:flavonoid glycosyltransferase YjiC (YdhE family)
MRIGIQTWGSTGDIHPFLALAGGLAAAGHRVTLALTSAQRTDYQPVADRLGFALRPAGFIGINEDELIGFGRRTIGTASPLAQLRVIIHEMFEPGVPAMSAAAAELCAGHDLLVGHFILHPLHCAAEKAGKPYLTVTLNHSAIPTRYAAPHPLPNLGPWVNRLLWRLAFQVLNPILLPPINRLRRESGLHPLASFRAAWESPRGNLIAVSPALCPPRPDWDASQRVCGFFTLPEAARPWSMPEDLARFLSTGPPPVFMTFGSMLGIAQAPREVADTTRLLVEAARVAGCRAIIQSHWSVLPDLGAPPQVYRLTEAPHDRILPHCAAAVHHGGAGTSQTVTRGGCPSVVVAHIADQFFWAAELRRMGVAGEVMERRQANPQRLGRAIRRTLDQPALAEAARRLGERLREEDGVREAVAWIEAVGSAGRL